MRMHRSERMKGDGKERKQKEGKNLQARIDFQEVELVGVLVHQELYSACGSAQEMIRSAGLHKKRAAF